MNPLIRLKQTTSVFLVAFGLVCFGLLRTVQAVSPPPDGGYPGGNTAEGQDALSSLTTGSDNTAIGVATLYRNTEGNDNTASGAGALLNNTTGNYNTSIGALTLRRNTTGRDNTATGVNALDSNTIGTFNTANGRSALLLNTTGSDNTAIGGAALYSNTTGRDNTAVGIAALNRNDGSNNTATGLDALWQNTTGSGNVALGFHAGNNQTTGSNNIYIGSNILGFAGENNACYIGSIFGQTSVNGVPVLINSDNKLGTATSSARFKRDIHDMDKASKALFALRPVAFRYKEEIDPAGISQLGLVAEDVEKVNPDLVVRDKEGKPYSVRHDQVNAMLLNEFLKEHKAFVQEQHKTEKLETTVANLVAAVKEQAAQIQKVSAQLELNKPAPQTVLNNQ
jgi:hypothetical protein